MAFKPSLNKYSVPSSLNKMKIDKVCESIKRGVPIKIACRAAGFSYTSFLGYKNQGNLDIDADLDTVFSQLVKRINQIDDERISSALADIREEKRGHLGAQWVLEKKYWKNFSARAETLELNEEIEKLKVRLALSEKEKESPVE